MFAFQADMALLLKLLHFSLYSVFPIVLQIYRNFFTEQKNCCIKWDLRPEKVGFA
jgi:hypothetical protein